MTAAEVLTGRKVRFTRPNDGIRSKPLRDVLGRFAAHSVLHCSTVKYALVTQNDFLTMKFDNARQSLRLFRYFFAAYPVRSTLMLLALTAAAAAEGAGIAALLPLLSLVIDAGGAGGALTRYVEWVFALGGLTPSLGGLLILIVVATGLKAVLMLAAMTQVGYAAAHVAMDLRLTFIRALLSARWLHFVDQRAGDLASAVSVEPTRAATSYVSTCRVLSGGLQLLIYIALSVAISWEVSLVAFVVGGFSMIALSRFVVMSRRAGKKQTDLQKSFMTRILQGLEGMKPLKAMAREGSLGPLIEADTYGLNHAQRSIVVSREALTESHELIRALVVAGGLYALVTVWGQPADGLLVIALLVVRTLQKLSLLQSHYQNAAVNQPAFAFLRSAIADAEQAQEHHAGGISPPLSSAISLRDVTFSYGRGNVLEGVSMTLPAGAFIAVVGASGVGKTTVADLIIGLLRPQRGEVWVDNLPMRDIDAKSWRGNIGYVPQETFVFHDTVMANVTLGNEDVSRAEVETALRRAEAWDFVEALSGGMDSVVGERGARLSGGQRQRIAIARALIRNPALLILDEATAALDPETEAGIVATVRRLAGRVTVLSISHQPAMKQAADLVYRLENGRALLEGAGDQPPMRASGAS